MINVFHSLMNTTNVVGISLRVVVGVAIGQIGVPRVGGIVRFRRGRPVIAIDAGSYMSCYFDYLRKPISAGAKYVFLAINPPF